MVVQDHRRQMIISATLLTMTMLIFWDADDYEDTLSGREYPDERSSPREHTVPAHGQHYHTKDGVIWREKEPYLRGGKHDDD